MLVFIILLFVSCQASKPWPLSISILILTLIPITKYVRTIHKIKVIYHDGVLRST